jgi:hypothetical protein
VVPPAVAEEALDLDVRDAVAIDNEGLPERGLRFCLRVLLSPSQ